MHKLIFVKRFISKFTGFVNNIIIVKLDQTFFNTLRPDGTLKYKINKLL